MMPRAQIQRWRRLNPLRYVRIDGTAVYASEMRKGYWRIQNKLEDGYFKSAEEAMEAADRLYPKGTL